MAQSIQFFYVQKLIFMLFSGSQSFLSQSFCSAEKNSSEKADKFSASRHVQLSKALEVLNLNPTQFHAIQAKPDKLKTLLEKTVKSRTVEFR